MKKMKKKQIKNKLTKEILSPVLIDNLAILGLGMSSVSTEGKLVKIDIDLLKKAIQILDVMGKSDVTFYIKTDCPLVIGTYDKDKKLITGVILAPIVD